MVVAVVALPAGGMDGNIHRAPFPVRHVLGEVQSQPPPLGGGKLGRQSHLEFTRHASILALLGKLGSIPEFGPVGRPLGRTIGQNDVGRFDATLAGVVVNLAGSLVGNLAPSAIGSGSGRTATG